MGTREMTCKSGMMLDRFMNETDHKHIEGAVG